MNAPVAAWLRSHNLTAAISIVRVGGLTVSRGRRVFWGIAAVVSPFTGRVGPCLGKRDRGPDLVGRRFILRLLAVAGGEHEHSYGR